MSWSERCAEGKLLFLLPFMGWPFLFFSGNSLVTILTAGFHIDCLFLAYSLSDVNSQLRA